MPQTDLLTRIQELQENLVQQWKQVQKSISLEQLSQDIQRLQKEAEKPHLWDDPENAQVILKQLADTEKSYKDIQEIEENLSITNALIDEGDISPDIIHELTRLSEKVDMYWQRSFFQEKYDIGTALVFIQAGAGGVDAQDFAEMITKMYLKFADRRKFKADVIEYVYGQEAGVKRSLLRIQGDYAYGVFRQERGVHRLVRISPFNSAGQRHTSFVLVQVLPEMTNIQEEDIEINPQDLRVDVFRSQGAGGQSVNTTDSAVRITHIPTNIVVSIQTERSQLQNKALAMDILKSKLWEKQQLEQKQEQTSNAEQSSISWGNHIRSYVLNPYKLVKDQRSNYETTDVERVLAGDLDDIITSVLISQQI